MSYGRHIPLPSFLSDHPDAKPEHLGPGRWTFYATCYPDCPACKAMEEWPPHPAHGGPETIGKVAWLLQVRSWLTMVGESLKKEGDTDGVLALQRTRLQVDRLIAHIYCYSAYPYPEAS